MVEPELVFGGLEAIFNRPAMAFHIDECRNRCARRAPGGEVCEIAVGDIPPDQQSSRPQTMVFVVEVFGFKISQFEVAPIVQPRAFGSSTSGEALPVACR